MSSPTEEKIDAATRADVPLRLVNRKSKLQTIFTIVIILYTAALVWSLARNDNLEWAIVGRYLFSAEILGGLWVTLWLSAITFVASFTLGLGIALMRMSKSAVLRGFAWTYVWIFRSTPLLVQLLVWFNIAALYPEITLGLPFAQEISDLGAKVNIELGPLAFSVSSLELITVILAALLALTLDCTAYASEVIRGGLLSVDYGQREAAYSLGVSRSSLMFRIVLPQAMRSIVPNAMNLLVNIIKGTTLVSVIAVHDVLYSAEVIYSKTFQVIPLLLVATVWYLTICSLLSVAAYYVERRFARGTAEMQQTKSLGRHMMSILRGGQAMS